MEMPREEKKVEYIELIYDLIFVYMLGKNNELLHHVEHGFFARDRFLLFIFASLALIQIWNYTSYYINLYGRNGIRDHVFLFINMYLIYFMGQGTGDEWFRYLDQYFIAWGLILVNIGVQYLIELKNHPYNPVAISGNLRIAAVLMVQAAILFISVPIYHRYGILLFPAAILFGLIASFIGSKDHIENAVDFAHLSERAMLYVVFSFGEMIITIASYFDGPLSPNLIYFSLMAFLIVVGLFISYEILYVHVIDGTMKTNGLIYMLCHIFLILGLNNITISLSLMRNDKVALQPKIAFLIISFVTYFVFLFALEHYSKKACRANRSFYLRLVPLLGSFILLMEVFRKNMTVNIAISAVYVFLIGLMLWHTTCVSCET